MRESRERLEERKRAAAEQIWLEYYNRVLYEKGIIGEEERNRMSNRIEARGRAGKEKPKRWESCR